MPGRHEAPGSGRFYRQLVGFVVLLVAAGVLVVGGAMFLENRLFSSLPPPPPATTEPATTEPAIGPPTTEPAIGPPTTEAAIAEPTTTSPAPTVRSPSEIEVLVLNGTGRSLLAATVTEELAAAGYRTRDPANADRSYSTSRILYGAGFGAEALELAERFPDAIVEAYAEPDPPADLIVILGASYEG